MAILGYILRLLSTRVGILDLDLPFITTHNWSISQSDANDRLSMVSE